MAHPNRDHHTGPVLNSDTAAVLAQALHTLAERHHPPYWIADPGVRLHLLISLHHQIQSTLPDAVTAARAHNLSSATSATSRARMSRWSAVSGFRPCPRPRLKPWSPGRARGAVVAETPAAVTFVRSRRVTVLALVTVALAVGEIVLPAGPTDVPIGYGRAVVAVYLLPLLVTTAWVVCVAPPSPDLERLLPDRVMRTRRTWWYLTATTLLVTAGGGALATASAIVTTTRLAWVPPFTVAVLVWLYGTTDQQGTPSWWAVPLHPADSVPTAIAAMLGWAAAGALYVVVDGRATTD